MKKSWWIGVGFGITAIAVIVMINPSTKTLFQSRFSKAPKNPPAESSESRNIPSLDKADTGVIPANLPSATPKSSVKPTSTASSKPTATPVVTSVPKASASSTQAPTATPTPTPKPTPTPTPTPVPDTQPPVFEYMTGPADGSTVTFNSFCFPMRLTDNFPGTISVRYSFDNSGPSEWGQNYAPCYQGVGNGFHVFVVQGRDAAGNETGHVSRNFNVSVSN